MRGILAHEHDASGVVGTDGIVYRARLSVGGRVIGVRRECHGMLCLWSVKAVFLSLFANIQKRLVHSSLPIVVFDNNWRALPYCYY